MYGGSRAGLPYPALIGFFLKLLCSSQSRAVFFTQVGDLGICRSSLLTSSRNSLGCAG